MVSKKKRSSPKLRLIFRPISQIQTFEGGCFPMGGGYFQFFTKNRPQKHQKHAILHTSQANGGGSSPPLATLLSVFRISSERSRGWVKIRNVPVCQSSCSPLKNRSTNSFLYYFKEVWTVLLTPSIKSTSRMAPFLTWFRS